MIKLNYKLSKYRESVLSLITQRNKVNQHTWKTKRT